MGLSDNGKLGHDDEYPYEDHMRSQPAFMVNGGQRKSSIIISFPNADGLNNYVVKREGELVRPVFTTGRVIVNGKPMRKERIVGGYEDGNGGLKKNLDNQVQMVASVPGDLGANANWHSQNGAPGRANWGSRAPRHNNGHFEVHNRPNWDSRASRMSRDDSPPRHNGRPNGGIRSTYTTYDDSLPRYYQSNELSRPSLDTKPNWPSRSQSPPMMQSGSVSFFKTRPKWPGSQDDSPPRVLMAHPNSGARPNWPIRNDSPSRAMEYYVSHHNSNSWPNVAKARDNIPPRDMEYYGSHPNSNSWPNVAKARDNLPPRAMEYDESHPNSNTILNWANILDDSPPNPIVNHLKPRTNLGANKPNWSSLRDYAPPRSMMHPELNHSNLGTRSNWAIQNESPPRIYEYYESSHPKSNARPNWTNARDDSPPKSKVHQRMAHPNPKLSRPADSNTMPNRFLHGATRDKSSTLPSDSPPKYVVKGKDQKNTSPLHSKLEKLVNIHDSRGSSPIPKKMNADNAKSGSKQETTQQVRESDQRPNWPNRKGQEGKEEHEKPKSNNDGGHIKKGNEEEIHGLANPKSVAVEATGDKSSTLPSDSPPKYVEKGKDQRNTSPLHSKLEKVNIHDSRGSSPIPNKMNADNAKSGSKQETTQKVTESDQRPNWPNRKVQEGKEEHEKPKSNDGGHIKKGSEEEVHGLANPKSVAVEATTRISSTQEIPKKSEDSYKKPSNNLQHDNLDDGNGNSKKSSSITPSSYTNGAGNTKADFNGLWYKQPGSTITSATSNVDDLMKAIEEAKRTGAYSTASEKPHWSEITPIIPPQGVRVSGPQWNEITPNPPVLDSTEARRRYTTGYPQPVVAAAAMGFYGGTPSSELKML
nr:serine/arginine repetitive matrix protein 1-like isoform X1 [Ipomoea trifida]